MPILRALKSSTILLAIAGTAACPAWAGDDEPWKNKPMEQWSQEDAKAVLADSPWVKVVQLQMVRDLSPDERRAGGDMEADIGKGVGLEGLLGLFNPALAQAAIERAHAKPDPGKVVVRWEARPVRASEARLGRELPPPDIEYYRIVVYDVATPKKWNLERELRQIAFLKRKETKDLKPSRVTITRKDDKGRADIVYLFPRSVEITKKDSYVGFWAQIGRLVVWQVFSPAEMQVQDRLEL